MISEELLLKFNARPQTFKKGAVIFSEGQSAKYYFQMQSGEVKASNYNEEGKEFIQGIFTQGDSFGEPTLLNGKPYLANAQAITDAVLLVQPKSDFLEMLYQHPETSIALCERLADRLYYNIIIASEIASQTAEHRLLTLIDFLKLHVNRMEADQKYEVKLTRQQLADLTGLRVETVIRTIKTLEKKGELKIECRKIYR